MSEDSRDLVLHGGYAIVVESERRVLRLTAPDGRMCLKIALLPEGPVVELSAVALAIATDGDVSVDCECFRVNARQEIVTEAIAQHHRARLGGIELVANDDVSLKGERIRLNAPEPDGRGRIELDEFLPVGHQEQAFVVGRPQVPAQNPCKGAFAAECAEDGAFGFLEEPCLERGHLQEGRPPGRHRGRLRDEQNQGHHVRGR